MKKLELTIITEKRICFNPNQIVAISQGLNNQAEIWVVGSEIPYRVIDDYDKVVRAFSSL